MINKNASPKSITTHYIYCALIQSIVKENRDWQMGIRRISPPNNALYIHKGQLISKELFAILELFQKTNKTIRSYYVLLGKKTNSFVHFLEESSA